jgi:hypothetical protein
MKKQLMIAVTACMIAVTANAQAVDFVKDMPDAKLVGTGEFNYIFWHLYDASLYTENGSFSFEFPFILKLTYKRELYGELIAEQAVKEMRGLGLQDEEKIARWYEQMLAIFPDVNDGVRLIGVYTPNAKTTFYHNEELAGEILDPDFGKWFFGIWLSEDTSHPRFRKKLIGENLRPQGRH